MMDLPVRRSEVMGEQMEVTISGLAGGHSGTEIHKNRANSNILAGRFLYELAGKMDYALIELEGGLKDNAIPRTTRMLLAIDGGEKEILKEEASRFTENLCREYSGTDDGITVTVEKTGEGAAPAPAAEVAARTCFRIGPFATRAAAEAARGRVDAVMPEPQLREEPGRASRYRVLLPPAEDRAQAQATAQRIAAAGFDDLFVLSQGAEANAIALGTYGSRETAQRRAAALQAAGFPAQVQAQGAAAASQWWWLGGSDDAQAVRAAHPAAQALDCTALAAPALR